MLSGVDKVVNELYDALDPETRRRVDLVADKVVQTKMTGGGVAVVTGSGPNLHEGVTTLIAELAKKGIVDGVITSSAVVAHEMAGTLDRVKRVSGEAVGVPGDILPRGGVFEVTIMDDAAMEMVRGELPVDMELVRRVMKAEGKTIIKAAGNMGYPMGLRTERVAREIERLSLMTGRSFEHVAGLGADGKTMIGAGAAARVPVVVSVPQLIGGGTVGTSIGDSMSHARRCQTVARVLAGASVIIESGIALAQEVHDGPFETYTGHGIWAAWEGVPTYSLQGKTLVRIDLDPNLEKVWVMEREGGGVQRSVDDGLPKTKAMNVPFRMEMSGFARLEGSIPIVGDLGAVWPVLAGRIAGSLGIRLDFMSFPQETQRGKKMRDWIVREVGILDRQRMMERLKAELSESPGGRPQRAILERLDAGKKEIP